jgi:hypothetical protein
MEVILTPGALRRAAAAVMSSQAKDGAFRGFSLEKLGSSSDTYEARFGDGRAWMPVGQVVLSARRRAYLCLSVDGRRTRLYYDGRLVRNALLPREIVESGSPLVIGNSAAKDRPFAGRIEEVRVEKRVLPESEIGDTYRRLSKYVPRESAGPGVFEFQIRRVAADLPDEVGRLAVGPDGEADNTIQLGVVEGAGELSSVQIEISGPDGHGLGVWDSKSSTTFWIAAVYRNNRPVVQNKVADLQLALKEGDEIQVRVTGNGSVQSGRRFQVTLTMQDGRVATQEAVVP